MEGESQKSESLRGEKYEHKNKVPFRSRKGRKALHTRKHGKGGEFMHTLKPKGGVYLKGEKPRSGDREKGDVKLRRERATAMRVSLLVAIGNESQGAVRRRGHPHIPIQGKTDSQEKPQKKGSQGNTCTIINSNRGPGLRTERRDSAGEARSRKLDQPSPKKTRWTGKQHTTKKKMVHPHKLRGLLDRKSHKDPREVGGLKPSGTKGGSYLGAKK